jgi:hypothetical protein
MGRSDNCSLNDRINEPNQVWVERIGQWRVQMAMGEPEAQRKSFGLAQNTGLCWLSFRAYQYVKEQTFRRLSAEGEKGLKPRLHTREVTVFGCVHG